MTSVAAKEPDLEALNKSAILDLFDRRPFWQVYATV